MADGVQVALKTVGTKRCRGSLERWIMDTARELCEFVDAAGRSSREVLVPDSEGARAGVERSP